MAKKVRYNRTNEQVIIGAALADADARGKILGAVHPDQFVGKKHVVIMQAVAQCHALGLTPDASTVAVNCDGEFGGAEYLNKLIAMGVPSGLTQCLDILRKDHTMREADTRIEKLQEEREAGEIDYGDYVQAATGLLHGLKAAPMQTGDAKGDAKSWKDQFGRARRGEVFHFVPTAIPALDELLTEGFAPKNLTVIGGRPRMGKTMLMIQMIVTMLVDDYPTPIAVFALEKGKDYIVNLLLSNLTGIPLKSIIKYPEKLSDKQVKKLERMTDWMYDTGRIVIKEEIFKDLVAQDKWNNKTAVERMGELMATVEYGVGFWDVWSMALTNDDQGPLSSALRVFSEYGRNTNKHNVILHHVNREAENRSRDAARRPTINDLRGSGQFEQSTDTILLIHRERALKKYVPKGDQMEIIVGKQKTGPEGDTILADFNPVLCRVENSRIAKPEDLRSAGAAFRSRGSVI